VNIVSVLKEENARRQGIIDELRKRSRLLAAIQGAGFWRRVWWVIAGVPHE
jgi:hypothetical protein